MFHHHGRENKLPLILLHAGARDYSEDSTLLAERKAAVRRTVDHVWPILKSGMAAIDAVQLALELLEAEPACNAGYGGAIQSDGVARLSASMMNGTTQKFSGVMLVTHLVHPSKLARVLQDRDESVLGPLGAQLLARELGIPPQKPVHPAVAQAWADYIKDSSNAKDRTGTVGAAIIDINGNLAAGTSTGGTYMNTPERISDSATVAGNYASKFAATSCTGKGEEIVDDAVAARVEGRIRDGMDIQSATARCMEEGVATDRTYGFITVDHTNGWALTCLADFMPSCVMSGDREEPYLP